jgi:hypothetical protein
MCFSHTLSLRMVPLYPERVQSDGVTLLRETVLVAAVLLRRATIGECRRWQLRA